MAKQFKPETLCVQAGWTPKKGEPRVLPIYQSTTFKYDTSEQMARLFDLEDSGYFYTRLQNPTNDAVAAKIAALEGGVAAMLTSSGQAANFYAIFNICQAGDHFVCSSAIYGGTFNLFGVTMKKLGIDVTFVNPDASEEEISAAFKPNTKAVYIESLGNPVINIVDMEAVAKIAHKHGIPLIVDNTFGTPYLIRPIEFGADVVVHSATKFIGGHGSSLGGVIIDSGKFDWAASGKFPGLTEPDPSYHGVKYVEALGNLAYIMKIRVTLLRDTGATLAPFHSFLFLQGLESLHVRVERHVENTVKIVNYLNRHEKVAWVNYPGLEDNPYHVLAEKYFKKGCGSIFTFGVKGGKEAAIKFIDSLQIFSILANVADAKSLVIHPATTTHLQLSAEEQAACGITPDTIRFSIGIEDADDLIADIEQALEQI